MDKLEKMEFRKKSQRCRLANNGSGRSASENFSERYGR